MIDQRLRIMNTPRGNVVAIDRVRREVTLDTGIVWPFADWLAYLDTLFVMADGVVFPPVHEAPR